MSTTGVPVFSSSHAGTGRVTPLGVFRSEWTKLWSLRSTRWSLLVAVIAMAGLGILISAVQMGHWSQMSLSDRASFNPVDVSLGGWHLAQLAIGVLGVLVISGEYSTGSIRSTFAAVPRRLPVLWGKAAVFALATFALMLPSAFVAFFASQEILTDHHVQTSLGDPNVARAVIGAALFLTALGLLGLAIGALVRNTAGGIAAFAGVMFVLPGLNALLPSSWSNAIDPYLPLSAGSAIMAIRPDSSLLSPWAGFAVFCGYTVALGALAAYLLVRRDA
jgi:ABC-type transport system involved in multi-copper enzyme maturation permease subunit